VEEDDISLAVYKTQWTFQQGYRH